MDIYRQELIDHYQNPRNYGRLIDADVIMELENISCGDKISLFVKLKSGKIEKISFEGEGCAVAIASASILTEYSIGKKIKSLEKLSLEDFVKVLKVELTLSRLKCAGLSLETLKKALKSVDQKVIL